MGTVFLDYMEKAAKKIFVGKEKERRVHIKHKLFVRLYCRLQGGREAGGAGVTARFHLVSVYISPVDKRQF